MSVHGYRSLSAEIPGRVCRWFPKRKELLAKIPRFVIASYLLSSIIDCDDFREVLTAFETPLSKLLIRDLEIEAWESLALFQTTNETEFDLNVADYRDGIAIRNRAPASPREWEN